VFLNKNERPTGIDRQKDYPQSVRLIVGNFFDLPIDAGL
jgi:hypothetical protein